MESPRLISAACAPYEPLRQEESSSDDFEFALVTTDPEIADEIISDGRILPVFNRDILAGECGSAAEEEKAVTLPFQRLLIDERADRTGSASSSSEFDKHECSRKSSSTGSSSSRRWGLRELFMNRSHSDGKDKFVLLERPPPPEKEKRIAGQKPNPKVSAATTAEVKEGEKGKCGKGLKGGRVTEMDMITAHRLYYGKNSGQGAKGGRRSYLPYRQELLVGFFSNGTHH